MKTAVPGSRGPSFTGSDSSETDISPGGDRNFSAASPNRMARTFHKLKGTVKRVTGGSDTGSNIDGSSFTSNPFADNSPFSVPPEPAPLLPSVNFPAAASQRALQQTRAITPLRATTTAPAAALPPSISRSTSHSDLRSSTPALPTQVGSNTSGGRSQSRSTDGGGKSGGGLGLKDGDLEPYRRTSSKTSMQGTLTRMAATIPGTSNPSWSGATPADSQKAAQRPESLQAQPTARPDASGKPKLGDLIRTQLAGPQVAISAEDLQMQRLQQLARDARGSTFPPAWESPPLLPVQQGLGSSSMQGSGYSVELAAMGTVQALSEDDESREAALEKELQLPRALSPRPGLPSRSGGPATVDGLWGSQSDTDNDLSDSGTNGSIPSRGGKPSPGFPNRGTGTGGNSGRKQVSFGETGKLHVSVNAMGSTGRQPRTVDRIAHRQRLAPVVTQGPFDWLLGWLPTRGRRNGTAAEHASLRGAEPYSSEDPSSAGSSPIAGASPTWTNLRAHTPPYIGDGLQKGSAYMQRYLTTIREKVAAAIDVEAGPQAGEVQEDETPRCRGFAAAMCCVMCLILLVGVVELWIRKPTLLIHTLSPPATMAPPPVHV